MLFSYPKYLPTELRYKYRLFQIVLYVSFFLICVFLTLAFLFPYETQNITFSQNQSKKDTLLMPSDKTGDIIKNGQIPTNDSLSVLSSSWNTLERIDIDVTPSKKSTGNLSNAEVTIRRGHGAFFFPQKTERASFPSVQLFVFNDTYYQEINGVLQPFVSKAAFTSNYKEELALPLTPEEFAQKSVGEEMLGFRPGTLLAYADGVFVTGENLTFSAFASPEVLLRLGYTFNHVLPVNAEEVGIYKRTATLLPGSLHPAGTIFYEEDSQQAFLLKEGSLWLIEKEYSDFLKSQNDFISLSSAEQQTTATCSLKKSIFSKKNHCSVSVLPLVATGDSYQVTIQNNTDQILDIENITVGLQASREKENALRILTNIRNNLLSRFGITYE